MVRYKPLVEGKTPELLRALEDLMLRKLQGRSFPFIGEIIYIAVIRALIADL